MSSVGSVYIGKKAAMLEAAPKLPACSKVVLNVTDELFFESGNDLGWTLTAFCPFGTQEMCDNILTQVRGYRYQPFSADTARIDPAAELGDAVTVGDTYSVLASMDCTFGPGFSANIGAPYEEEIDHEYPYKPQQDRTFTRKLASVRAELKIEGDKILSSVTETETNLKAEFSTFQEQTAKSISAKVSSSSSSTNEAGDVFGWELLKGSWTIKSNDKTVFKVNRKGAYVDGEIVASSGKIGGYNITSSCINYNGLIWSTKDEDISEDGGVYLGTHGIRLGKNFKVSAAGKLKAIDGDFSGKITATSGTIGGFDILADCIRSNSMTWGGTNENGVYLGANGLQCGSKDGGARIAKNGDAVFNNLTANNGTFKGVVLAKNISGQITGSQIGAATISTGNFMAGINTSLGYADFANDVFNGRKTAEIVGCKGLSNMGQTYSPMTIFYTDWSGAKKSVKVFGRT